MYITQKKKMHKRLTEYDLTEFQILVLLSVISIPKGKTRTYKEVAKMIKHPGAYRAVGTALKKNPFPIIVPCHRIIKSNGQIGNYALGAAKKIRLLKEEKAI